jgi:hypothetical protein
MDVVVKREKDVEVLVKDSFSDKLFRDGNRITSQKNSQLQVSTSKAIHAQLIDIDPIVDVFAIEAQVVLMAVPLQQLVHIANENQRYLLRRY